MIKHHETCERETLHTCQCGAKQSAIQRNYCDKCGFLYKDRCKCVPVKKKRNPPRPLGLEWRDNNRDGKQHEEWSAPCGCAYHPEPAPHVHPCESHKQEPAAYGVFSSYDGTFWEAFDTEEDALEHQERDDVLFPLFLHPATRASKAESELASLRASIRALAEKWKTDALVCASQSAALKLDNPAAQERKRCAAELIALEKDHAG